MHLVRLFQDYASGKHETLLALQANPTTLPNAAPQQPEEEREEFDMDEAEEEDNALAEVAAGMDMRGDAEEDDGWTVVKPKTRGGRQ